MVEDIDLSNCEKSSPAPSVETFPGNLRCFTRLSPGIRLVASCATIQKVKYRTVIQYHQRTMLEDRFSPLRVLTSLCP
jgi:hypothetical protein